ncbi:GH1 family beta-glucosidase [Chitinophaga sp. Cy-1792]|uniref:GH1 family beta-glucosidase n=1 Tax=Chitinophaga sp. Cy-1792 TaxID=2608339 RepID=UPI00141E380B|nr:GH1 family beta-glucosidase [Chitinophaga sp. Cy-1792]NIG57171.1 beta-glucosidase [Chitinophaga sp. Cy-1792]
MQQSAIPFTQQDFGDDFLWGVTISAFQNEGAFLQDGKGLSIWDTFSARKGKIKDRSHAQVATDFYNRFLQDILLAKILGFSVFRFSIAWARILPKGTGEINPAGVAFYHKVIDACLELGLEPYITLYHWDLPQALEHKGGWCHRGVVFAFEEFTRICIREYGGKVRNWIVLNEPFGYTALGYMLGVHAPGKFGLSYFLPAVHHTVLAQSGAARVIREELPEANIGTTFSCSQIIPYTQSKADIWAAKRADALFNRMFIEPALGMGYPVDDFPLLKKIVRRYSLWRDWDNMAFDFDFIGIQNYFPLVVKYNAFMPLLKMAEVKPKSRNVPVTGLGWEISGHGLYEVLKQFSAYKGVKKIIVTEGGASFPDTLHEDGGVHDTERVNYFREYLGAVLAARREGIPVDGYFAWTLTDNFEWAEGYRARFGLVYVNFETQQRIIKDSGYWFKSLLNAD